MTTTIYKDMITIVSIISLINRTGQSCLGFCQPPPWDISWSLMGLSGNSASEMMFPVLGSFDALKCMFHIGVDMIYKCFIFGLTQSIYG